jgi:hypothetical protein
MGRFYERAGNIVNETDLEGRAASLIAAKIFAGLQEFNCFLNLSKFRYDDCRLAPSHSNIPVWILCIKSALPHETK